MGVALDWDEVVDQLGPRLYSYFSRRHLAEGASDLTQETLLRLFDKVQGGLFDEAKGNLAQLAFGIAHFVGLEAHKLCKSSSGSQSADDLSEQLVANSDIEGSLQGHRVQTQVRHAITKLSSQQQEVLALILDEELTTREIAEILKISENTIKSHILRAKEALRQDLSAVWEVL